MKMKNIYLALAAAFVLPFQACSLKEDTSAISTPENFFRNKAECQSVVNSCYIPIKSIYNYTYFLAVECVSDVMYCPSGTRDAQLDISPAVPRFGQTMWTQGYLGVQRCNYAIAGIEASEGLSDEDRTELLCEAKVLRALFYWHLTCFFGDVPFYFDDVKDQETLLRIAALPRMSAVETRDKVIEDLLGIIPQAKQTRTSDNEGHRLGAACGWMLVAKLAMWNKEWEKALEAIAHIEDIYGDFSQYDYAENVMFRNRNTPESIFEIQHTYTQGGLVYTSNVACVCTPTRKTVNGITTFDGVEIRNSETSAPPGPQPVRASSSARVSSRRRARTYARTTTWPGDMTDMNSSASTPVLGWVLSSGARICRVLRTATTTRSSVMRMPY